MIYKNEDDVDDEDLKWGLKKDKFSAICNLYIFFPKQSFELLYSFLTNQDIFLLTQFGFDRKTIVVRVPALVTLLLLNIPISISHSLYVHVGHETKWVFFDTALVHWRLTTPQIKNNELGCTGNKWKCC